MPLAPAELPLEVREKNGVLYLHYWGTLPDGQKQPMQRPVGAAQPGPVPVHRDALGDAILELLAAYRRLEAERDELQRLVSEEEERQAPKGRKKA